jgi:hypothetical protein
MTSTPKLKSTIGRARRSSVDPANQGVHFHLSDGRPCVRDVHACNPAALTFGDLRLVREVAK